MTDKVVAYPIHRGPFKQGDLVLLVDSKGRRYTVVLDHEQTFHTHKGTLFHDQIIGAQEGTKVTTSLGQKLLAIRPVLGDIVLAMDHVTQVIYPKDLGPILIYGDIFPGAHVVEIGLGSGALTMALLRAVGSHGKVTSYEVRETSVERALKNIRKVIPNPHNLTIKVQDAYEGIDESEVDRVVIDVPEPWGLVPSISEVLIPGGIFLSFLPTVLQVHKLAQAFRDDHRYQLVETIEVIHRPWHVSQQSMRPAHRMVAHTGFITTARRCPADNSVPTSPPIAD